MYIVSFNMNIYKNHKNVISQIKALKKKGVFLNLPEKNVYDLEKKRKNNKKYVFLHFFPFPSRRNFYKKNMNKYQKKNYQNIKNKQFLNKFKKFKKINQEKPQIKKRKKTLNVSFSLKNKIINKFNFNPGKQKIN